MKPPRARTALVVALAGLLMAPAGCDREDPIRVYTAPREDAHPVAARQPVDPDREIVWTVPEGWVQLPASGEGISRRVATLRVDPNDPSLVVTVTNNLSGEAAVDVLGNVNRWRNQLGLPAATADDLPKYAQHADSDGGLHLEVIDLQAPAMDGRPAMRTLAALHVRPSGRVWAFKITGPDEKVDPVKPAFQTLLRSLRAADGSAAPAHAHAGPPATAPASGAPSAGSAAAAAPAHAMPWKAPPDWRLDPTPRQMRLATYLIGPPEAQAGLAISVFATGSFTNDPAGNVNTWRSQIGLPVVEKPLEAHPPRTFVANGRPGTLFDIHNPQSQLRMLLAMIDDGQGSFFYFKLAGPAATVEATRPTFEQFLQTVRVDQAR